VTRGVAFLARLQPAIPVKGYAYAKKGAPGGLPRTKQIRQLADNAGAGLVNDRSSTITRDCYFPLSQRNGYVVGARKGNAARVRGSFYACEGLGPPRTFWT
jgi:hypothetical protein